MRIMIGLVSILISLSIPPLALAGCSTQTYTFPDGRMMICTTCCMGTVCQTNCI
jgi:hypothetical protein